MSSNYLTYPLKNMNITQAYSGTYSHSPHTTGNPKDYPWDEAGGSPGREYLYCPCDEMKIVRLYTQGTNTIWLESTQKVKLANGIEDYVSCMIIHPNDDDMSSLSVGQVFKRGDAICREGTDGQATGNHLHLSFGIGKISGTGWTQNTKGKWVLTTTGGTYPPEALIYIDDSFTKVIQNKGLLFKKLPENSVDNTTNSSTNSYEPIDSSNGTNIELSKDSSAITYESTVLPRRVSNSGSQPFLAYVEIFIAGQLLTFVPPQHIINMDFDRVDDSGSTLILTVFDKNWDDLELLFSNNFGNVQLRYGLVGGKSSKSYNLELVDYSIEFNTAGTLLTLRGHSTGVVDNLDLITMDTNTTNPTEAAKQICRRKGWLVIDTNFEPSLDVNFSNKDTIALMNEHPATYIKYHLAPIARSLIAGESGYKFYLDDSTNPPTAHFKIPKLVSNAHKTYIYMKGIDSPIIDLSLRINGVNGGFSENSVFTEAEASFIDPITKEKVTLSEDINSNRVLAAGEYSHTKSKQSKEILDSAGASPSQMNAILNYRVRTAMPYEGEMTILGDPEIEFYEVIRLMIITDKGNLHHSSGLYHVTHITDTISDGSMFTRLEIFRREDIESGIEVVNYRTLLK